MAGILSQGKDAITNEIVRKIMAEAHPWLEVLRDILGPLTKTKWGTKFLGLLAADGVIGYLAYLGLGKVTDQWPMVAMVAVAAIGIMVTTVIYYKFRSEQETLNSPNSPEPKTTNGGAQ